MTKLIKTVLITSSTVLGAGAVATAIAVPLSLNTNTTQTVVQAPQAINYIGISSQSTIPVAPFTFVQRFNALSDLQQKLNQLFTTATAAQPTDAQVTRLSEFTVDNTSDIIARTNGARAVIFTVNLRDGFSFEDGSTSREFRSDIRGVAGIRTPGNNNIAGASGGATLGFRSGIQVPTAAGAAEAIGTVTPTRIQELINRINGLSDANAVSALAASRDSAPAGEGTFAAGQPIERQGTLSRAILLFRLFSNVTQPTLNAAGIPTTSAGFLNWNSAWFIRNTEVVGNQLRVRFEAAPTWVVFEPTDANNNRILEILVG